MYYAFDLDGTLVDTRDALYAAYQTAGVVPPHDFFGKPFYEWYKGKDAATIHSLKNKAYKEMLHLIKPLPLIELYKRLGYPPILTGASQSATILVLRHFKLQPEVIHFELTVSSKISIMQAYEEGIMFEDNLEAAHRMRKETKWTICHTLS